MENPGLCSQWRGLNGGHDGIYSVGATGFEPATSCSQSKHSNRAELRPETCFVSDPPKYTKRGGVIKKPFIKSANVLRITLINCLSGYYTSEYEPGTRQRLSLILENNPKTTRYDNPIMCHTPEIHFLLDLLVLG